MSWSVSGSGKASEVAEGLKKQFESIRCIEPEMTIANHVAAAVQLAVSSYPPEKQVLVSCSGSQYTEAGGITNSLSVTVKEQR